MQSLGLGGLLLFLAAARALGRAQHHDHCSAFDVRHLIHRRGWAKVLGHALQDTPSNILVRHLPTAKSHREFDLIACFEELERQPALRLQVMLADLRAEADLFDVGRLLPLARFALAPALLVAELAIIHETTHRRDGVGLYFDEVESALAGHLQRIPGAQNADVRAVFVDQANLWDANALIDTDGSSGADGCLP